MGYKKAPTIKNQELRKHSRASATTKREIVYSATPTEIVYLVDKRTNSLFQVVAEHKAHFIGNYINHYSQVVQKRHLRKMTDLEFPEFKKLTTFVAGLPVPFIPESYVN